jgi:hypothetical protein
MQSIAMHPLHPPLLCCNPLTKRWRSQAKNLKEAGRRELPIQLTTVLLALSSGGNLSVHLDVLSSLLGGASARDGARSGLGGGGSSGGRLLLLDLGLVVLVCDRVDKRLAYNVL